MRVLCPIYGSDLTEFYQSLLKSGSAAGIIEKSRKGNAYAQLSRMRSSTAEVHDVDSSVQLYIIMYCWVLEYGVDRSHVKQPVPDAKI